MASPVVSCVGWRRILIIMCISSYQHSSDFNWELAKIVYYCILLYLMLLFYIFYMFLTLYIWDWRINIIFSFVLTFHWGWWLITETCRRIQVYAHLIILLFAHDGVYDWSDHIIADDIYQTWTINFHCFTSNMYIFNQLLNWN